jgi:hypothetical protein
LILNHSITRGPDGQVNGPVYTTFDHSPAWSGKEAHRSSSEPTFTALRLG